MDSEDFFFLRPLFLYVMLCYVTYIIKSNYIVCFLCIIYFVFLSMYRKLSLGAGNLARFADGCATAQVPNYI